MEIAGPKARASAWAGRLFQAKAGAGIELLRQVFYRLGVLMDIYKQTTKP